MWWLSLLFTPSSISFVSINTSNMPAWLLFPFYVQWHSFISDKGSSVSVFSVCLCLPYEQIHVYRSLFLNKHCSFHTLFPCTLPITISCPHGNHFLNPFVCIHEMCANKKQKCFSYLFCSLSHQEKINKRRKGVNNLNGTAALVTTTVIELDRYWEFCQWWNKIHYVTVSLLTSPPPFSSSSDPSSRQAVMQAAQPPHRPVGGDSRWGGKKCGNPQL